MFRFRELSLFNWDYWAPLRLPLDREVVLLTGPNGSGKTTLLDAVRQLLNAPRLSSRRRLQHYLRRPDQPALIQAVVSNEESPGFGQPFRRERITTPEATLACMLVPSGSGAPEKRFAVLPGRVPVAELQNRLLQPRGDWLPPERYARVLEQAGVSRSLMSVLALEQGKTNALFEMSSRQLLQHVLEMLGDRAVLERYRDARRRYEESDREVSRQMHELQRLQLELNRVQREVVRLDDWERARAKVEELEARLPAARLQEALRRRNDAAQKLPELRTKLRKGETEILRLEAAAAEARAAEERAGRAVTEARAALDAAQRHRDAAAAADGALRAEEQSLATDEAAAASLPAGDESSLEAAESAAARARFGAEAEGTQAEDAARRAAERLGELEGGRAAHPPQVERLLAALAERGIGATLLAAAVEVEDPYAAAAEAALGDLRYAVTVPPGREAEALALAREHAFPGPVAAGEALSTNEAAGPLRLGPGAPPWLREWSAATRLAADGAWRDDHGAWAPRSVAPALGERARRAAIEEARALHAAASSVLSSARAAANDASGAHARATAALATERRRRALLDRASRLPGVRAALSAASARLATSRAAHEERAQEHLASQLSLQRARAEAGRAQDGIEEVARRLDGERAATEAAEADTARYDAEVRELAPDVEAELRARAERMDLDAVETVEGDLRRARAALEALGAQPDPTVREEARHLAVNVEEAERHVQARAREAQQAREELSACRLRYLEVVSAALQDYRRRAVEIARPAGVAVEMDLPRLLDDDRALDEAELSVRLGFDGKDPLPLGDSSFSGGQQVIAGLVLLMSMVEGGGRGFFMLDEPFAHLSIDRIDDVGRFLRSSGAQFLITAPTTLDRAQLDPASLVLMLRKKRTGEPHAPVPVVAEA